MPIIDDDDELEAQRRRAASAPEFSHETIQADPATAVYFGIPPTADAALLRHAHDATMQRCEALARELGADATREENFERAVRRLDELDSRLRPAMPDAEAERQAAPEKEQAAEKEPMTIEAIERDTWAAVDRDIPPDADRAFLATVAVAAEHCEKFADAAARVGEVMEPELVEFYQERRADAAERRDEAWRQFTVRAPEQSSQKRLLNPEELQDRAMSSLHAQAHEPRAAAGQGAEITHEALDKNPWVVLSGVLAEFDDRALLDRIDGTLHDLRNEATQRRAAAGSPEEAELWRVVAGDAESRGREAREEIANLTARESDDEISRAAEKEPMTIEAIDRDPSNAVKLDIPQDASLELLEHARKAAAHEVDRIEDYIQYDREDVADGAVEEWEAAEARIAELDERLEPAISPADEISRPLSAVERNERVRRIIENPHLEGAERDDGVLQALAEQREELGLAEPERQDDAPQVEYSQEPEVQSSADRDAAEIDYLFGREEMTEARAAAYDRYTGQELSPRSGQTAGQVQEAGQSQSQTRGRSR